jgi:hypothetical protein
MDTRVDDAAFEIPMTASTKSSSWEAEKLDHVMMGPIMTRLSEIAQAELSDMMLVREFLRWRIAPLQEHRHKMWAFNGFKDAMRLSPHSLDKAGSEVSLKKLLGEAVVPEPSQGALSLYYQKTRASILKEMPTFDRWGPCPIGLKGDRSNPFLPIPDLGSAGDIEETGEEEVDAGGERGEASSRGNCRASPLEISSDDEEVYRAFSTTPL